MLKRKKWVGWTARESRVTRVEVDYLDSLYLYLLDLSRLWDGIVVEARMLERERERERARAQARIRDDDLPSL